MLAARIHGHGGNEVLRLDEIPIPNRKPGELRIRMIAGGLNRVDLYMRNSGAGITHRLPIILGLDGAGMIEEADAGTPFRAGDPRGSHVLEGPSTKILASPTSAVSGSVSADVVLTLVRTKTLSADDLLEERT